MSAGRFQKIFSAAAQTVLVQGLGMLFFYLNSLYLPKGVFGVLNTYVALAAVLNNILSGGLEQVAFRRMAAGQVQRTFGTFLVHVLVTAAGAALLLWVGFYAAGERLQYLCWFYGGQAFFYVAGPFRTYLNAKQHYTPYALITLGTNLLRIAGLLILHFTVPVTLYAIAMLLAGTMALEALLLALVVLKQHAAPPLLYKSGLHKAILAEARPQYGALLLETALSRADWILMSLLTTGIVTADYSFAYRAFEVARMPVIIMTTLLLPRLSKWLATAKHFSEVQKDSLREINFFVLAAGGLIALISIGLWSPALDVLTKGKYGTANFWPFFILVISLPLHFIINLYWIISFAQVQYSITTKATFWAAIVNIGANLILIPFFGSSGAAIAFGVSTLVQLTVYLLVLKGSLALLPAARSILKVAGALVATILFFFATEACLPVALQLITGFIFYVLIVLQSNKKFRNTIVQYGKRFSN